MWEVKRVEVSQSGTCAVLYIYMMFSILSIGAFMKSVKLPLRLPEKVLEEIDRLVEAGLYQSRSEAIGDAAWRLIESKRLLIEETITSSKVPPLHPDKVIEELRKIREEHWRRRKKIF